MASRTCRLLPTGDIVFPCRGGPPGPIQGFVRDKTNPYLFHNILKPCVLRGAIWIKKGCGGDDIKHWCDHYSKKVRMIDCLECPFIQPSTLPSTETCVSD